MSKLTSRGDVTRQILAQMAAEPVLIAGAHVTGKHPRPDDVILSGVFGFLVSLASQSGWKVDMTLCTGRRDCLHIQVWR